MPVNLIPPTQWTGRDDPEDGADALRLHHLAGEQGSRAILGFASEAGVIRNKGRAGAREGPAAIRKALANMAAPEGAGCFVDLGDIEVADDDLEDGQSALADRLETNLGNFDRVVVLGGGHETAFGSYCGLAQKYPGRQIGIINLDAHLDMRLVGENGPSSGTPFAQIRALNPEKFDYLCLGVAGESNTVSLMKRAREWNVAIVADHELIADQHAGDEAIAAIIERSDLIYLTIDIDVLPHFQAPGVSAPAPRGVRLSTIEHIVRQILKASKDANCACPLADIVELCPPHDNQGVAAKTAALLTCQILFT